MLVCRFRLLQARTAAIQILDFSLSSNSVNDDALVEQQSPLTVEGVTSALDGMVVDVEVVLGKVIQSNRREPQEGRPQQQDDESSDIDILKPGVRLSAFVLNWTSFTANRSAAVDLTSAVTAEPSNRKQQVTRLGTCPVENGTVIELTLVIKGVSTPLMGSQNAAMSGADNGTLTLHQDLISSHQKQGSIVYASQRRLEGAVLHVLLAHEETMDSLLHHHHGGGEGHQYPERAVGMDGCTDPTRCRLMVAVGNSASKKA